MARGKDPKLSVGRGFAVYPNVGTEGPMFLAYIARQRAHADGRMNLRPPSGTGSLVGPGMEKFVGTADEILDFLDKLKVPSGAIGANLKFDEKRHMLLLQVGSRSYIVCNTTRRAPAKWIQELVTNVGPKLGVPRNDLSNVGNKKRKPHRGHKPRRRHRRQPTEQEAADTAPEVASEQPAQAAPAASTEEHEAQEPEKSSPLDSVKRLLGAADGQPDPKMSISELGLGTRIENALANAKVNTVGKLLAKLVKSDEDVLAIDGIGKQGLKNIKSKLNKKGFELP